MSSISSLGIGSGLDLNGTLAAIESAERLKIRPIQVQQVSVQSKISAFGAVKGGLTGLQDALTKLKDGSGFQQAKSSVAGESIKAASTDKAAVGTYEIEVTALAKSFSVATQGIEKKDENLGAGTVTLTKANGDELVVELEQDQSSLENLRDKINKLDSGVVASIVNDGSGTPYRLSIASTETGTDAAVSNIDFGDLSSSLQVDETTEIQASNAKIKMNGIDIESQSNQIREAVEGVTITVEELGKSTLTVERDNDEIKGYIKTFVEKYNELNTTIREQRKFNGPDAKSGVLLGNSTLRGIENELRAVFETKEESGAFGLLSDLGISKELDGSLKMDEEKVEEAIENNLQNVKAFFEAETEETGFASRLSNVIESMTEDGGLLSAATTGLNSQADRLDDRQQRIEDSIASTLAQLRKEFAKLDGTVASLNATGGQLLSQLSNIQAQFGGSKDQ